MATKHKEKHGFWSHHATRHAPESEEEWTALVRATRVALAAAAAAAPATADAAAADAAAAKAVDQNGGGDDDEKRAEAAVAAVDAQLRQGGEEGVTDANVRRWLAARGYDPHRAAHDLCAHAAWRASFVPRGRVLDSEMERQVAQRKAYVTGPSEVTGAAVVVFCGERHIPLPDPNEITRFFCFTADAAIALADASLNPGARVVLVFAAGGFGWKNFDVSGLTMLFRMIHTHYVERLQTLYIHGSSTAFRLLYDAVSPLIDPATRRRVRVLPGDAAAAAAELAAELGAAALPPMLGGVGAPRAVEEAWALIERARAAGVAPCALARAEACSGAGAGSGKGDVIAADMVAVAAPDPQSESDCYFDAADAHEWHPAPAM